MTKDTFTNQDQAVIDSFQWLTIRHEPGCTGTLTMPNPALFQLACTRCDLIAFLREDRPTQAQHDAERQRRQNLKAQQAAFVAELNAERHSPLRLLNGGRP